MMGSLNDIINGKENRTKKSGMKRGTSVMIPIEKLMPNEDNKRSFGDRETRNIDVLAEELLISKKVLQNLVVRKMDDDRYLILSGHRRYYASLRNVENGHDEFSELPCEITEESDAMSYFNLLITNLSSEPLTEHEKMTATMHLKEVLPEVIGDDQLKGRKLREKIAETLHISQTKVAQYENISNNLVEDAMEQFENQSMNVSTANDLAGLPADVQTEFVKDGSSPVLSDVRTVKEEISIIRSYDQMSEQEKKEAGFMLDDLLVNTELKDYRSAIEKMCLIFLSADQSGVAKITGREDYASEVANMLLRYRKSRQFVGKNTAMNIFLNRRVLITRYIDGASKEIQFSHAGFFDTFCEVYREEIIGQVQEQEESDQMAIDDYDEDDPYEQIIPEKGSCDGKCFNCRNTECSDHVEKSDKCIYFDKIDCTIKYVFQNLKKDFPDMYKECTGCCMTCSVSESCGYACGRKDMSIVKERAGIPEIKADDEKKADIFAVPKEEEVASIKSMMTHVTINLVYLILKNNHDYKCNIEEIKDCIVSLKAERKPEKTEYAKHPCWTKAEYMGHGKYKVTYVFRELTNVREIMYDIYTVAELLHRAIAIGYFGNDDEMKFVRKHPCDEEIEQFVDSYSDWNCWIEISEIGAVFYRCRLEDETQIVAAEYRNILDLGCDVVYYYIPRFSELDHGFNSYKMTKDSIIEKLMR
ncbi:MAG: ParB N-terminal domain-containing protein [Agathobacter sp.]|nr:ParB N-terminal domain-containing protein [Agathobacter sp.]